MMTAEDVVEIIERIESEGVAVWLDGGWGVDALVGEQTREHDDLDIAIDLDQASTAGHALETIGFCQSRTSFRPGLWSRTTEAGP